MVNLTIEDSCSGVPALFKQDTFPRQFGRTLRDTRILPHNSLHLGFVRVFVACMTQKLLSYNSRNLPFLKFLLEINLTNAVLGINKTQKTREFFPTLKPCRTLLWLFSVELYLT